MPEYSGLKIDPFGDIWVGPHMKIANVIHRVLENKPSLLESHSVDGAPFYFTYMKYVFTLNTSISQDTLRSSGVVNVPLLIAIYVVYNTIQYNTWPCIGSLNLRLRTVSDTPPTSSLAFSRGNHKPSILNFQRNLQYFVKLFSMISGTILYHDPKQSSQCLL